MAAGCIATANIEDAVRCGAATLSQSSESARADALSLLAYTLGRSREWIVAHADEPLFDNLKTNFMALCERRRAGTPIAYILRSAGFYGREFVVDERVLVPRPETEHLADEAFEFIGRRAQREHQAMRVLDVGTGCGAIACTIAVETNAIVDATDISPSAIAVANENARRLNVTECCHFYCGDLIDPVAENRYHVVIANLPYIPTADIPQAPASASFEPRMALDGGSDGLSLYRRLLPSIPRLLKPQGLVLFEAAPPTMPNLQKLMALALSNFAISVGYDYAGLARYIKAER